MACETRSARSIRANTAGNACYEASPSDSHSVHQRPSSCDVRTSTGRYRPAVASAVSHRIVLRDLMRRCHCSTLEAYS